MAHIKQILKKKREKTFEYREAETEGDRWPCKDRDLRQLQAKECQGLMATVRNWKNQGSNLLQGLQRECGLTDTLILDVEAPKLWEGMFLLF